MRRAPSIAASAVAGPGSLRAELALKHRVPLLSDVRYAGGSREESMVCGPRVDEVIE